MEVARNRVQTRRREATLIFDQVQWFFAVLLTVLAGCLDWRSRRIPNWLTVSGLLIGMLVYGLGRGWSGVLNSLEGAGLMLGILLPAVLLRGLGAGDWKLMGATGAILGWGRVLEVLFASILVAGIIAVVMMVQQKRVRTTLSNMWELIRGFFIFGLRPNPEINLDNPAARSLPFGVAAAVGTVICFATVVAGR